MVKSVFSAAPARVSSVAESPETGLPVGLASAPARVSAIAESPETGLPVVLQTEAVPEAREAAALEYHAIITNRGGCTVRLKRAVLFRSEDLREAGLGQGPYLVFRSGRHKNDLPGVFEPGCPDARLADVSSAMTESGDGPAGDGPAREVVSDHLTLIRDASGRCLAISFLTGRDQLVQTRLELDPQGNIRRVTAETVFHILLDPGQSVRTETIRLAITRDPEGETEAFAARKAALYGARSRRTPAVYCTWYYYGLTVTLEDVRRNLRLLRQRKLPYDVFQLDEGWEKTLGEYEPNEKFPVPMAHLAREIREAGFVPGLWSSPFVAHETASVWRQHPSWILRRRDGSPCLFPMNDTVYLVFDITRAETRDYFRDLYRRFTAEWGFPYHKLDFTRAAVIYEDADFADKRITLARAYYLAVKAIREGMGEEAFLLMCGGLYDPIIGLADAQRTGSDVLSMWSSTVNRDGKTAPYTIRQSLQRAYMNHWWANDPDALMVRRNPVMDRGLRLTYGLLNDEEVKTCVVNQFAGGGLMCQTEPMDRIEDDRLMEIRHILPVTDRRVKLPGRMNGERFPSGADVFLPATGAHCLCLMNWSDTAEREVRVNLAELDLEKEARSAAGDEAPAPEKEARYVVCDFYSGEYAAGVSRDACVTFAPLKPHGATVIKVERMADRPIIVRSDGHYAMGAEFDLLELRGGLLRMRRRPLPVEVSYELLLPAPNTAPKPRTVRVTMPAGESLLEHRVEETASTT